jgi:hypothetical protein
MPPKNWPPLFMIKPKSMPKNQKRSPELSRQKISPNAYYRSRRRQPDSPFERAPPKKNAGRRLLKGLNIVLLILLLLALVNILLVSRHAKVIINDSTYHNAQEYQTFLDKRLGSLADSNKISFNQDSILAALRTNYPEIRAASVELLVFSRQPVFRLEVATPALFLKNQQKSYLVNTNGTAVGLENKYKNLSSLPEVTDQSGFDIKTGKQVLSSDDIQFILAVNKEMKVYGIPVKMLAIPNLAQQLNVYTTDSSYYTKFFTGGDPALQAAQMIAARQQFASSGGPSQYLDVRVSGKVFYK